MRTLRLTALLTALGLGAALAAGSPAGTVISNQASLTAQPSATGELPITSVSNTVITTVSAVCSPSVTPDGTVLSPGQRRSVLPGERATLPYRLLNTGNLTSTFEVSSVTDASGSFQPADKAVYLDDGTGVVQEGAQPVTRVTLDPDKAVNLLLVIWSAPTDRGTAFVSLNASCAGGEAADTDNVAAVTLDEPPALTFTKTFSPELVKPGDASTVTLNVINTGKGPSREVFLTDPLNTPELSGSRFVPASATAAGGVTEFSTDARTYAATEPGTVNAVRLRVPSLAPGAAANLTFKLLALPAAENRTLTNTATLTSSGVTSSASNASLTVRYSPKVAFGPVDRPNAPKGTPEATQTNPFAVMGQASCFTQTLLNSGDVADDFSFSSDALPDAGRLVLSSAGTPINQPVHLESAQSVTFQACFTPSKGPSLRLTLKVTGTRGQSDTTTDVITRIETRLPELLKTVLPSGQVMAGQVMTYTLTARNPYDVALTSVTVSDTLSKALKFMGASQGGTLQGTAVVWTFPTLAPGERLTLTLTARIDETAQDGDAVENAFAFSSNQIPAALSSAAVSSPVWTAALLVTKANRQTEVTYGDAIDYTVNIRNMSKVGTLDTLIVTDTLPNGLTYVPGSSRMDSQVIVDPAVNGPVLTWTLPKLGPLTEGILTYATRVTPQASAALINQVQVNARGRNGVAIASNMATAQIRVKPGVFSTLADIVGRVYVDRTEQSGSTAAHSGAGVYRQGVDTPVERARVLLSDGRVVLTDKEGRYHFAGVQVGFTALRLDPASVPYAPRSVPEDGGRPGSRGVNVQGLISVDFPLIPLSGNATLSRETSLRMGPFNLRKVVAVQGNTLTATLTLQSLVPLPGFRLTDPLPAGTILTTGQNTLSADLSAGQTTLTYTFEKAAGTSSFCGAECATTDPVVTWSTK